MTKQVLKQIVRKLREDYKWLLEGMPVEEVTVTPLCAALARLLLLCEDGITLKENFESLSMRSKFLARSVKRIDYSI